MKTNYKTLMITFAINLLMALSLNSFSTSSIYLPMIFLYFLSGLASFLDKISFYQSIGLKLEEKICTTCFCICFLIAFLYIANSLGFIGINFQNCEGTYRVLMQGIPNSFFTFNSVDITLFIFISAFMIPCVYLVLCIIPYLREHGFTKEILLQISRNHIKTLIILFFSSLVAGCIGICICYFKYIKKESLYGQPQYKKYFCVFFIGCLIITYILFIFRHRNEQQPHCTDTSDPK